MKLYPFEMERWQSTWENKVEYNLSESGVHPLQLSEILANDTAELLSQNLGYSQSNGTEELRRIISNMYPGAGVDDVLVTNGSSEANFVALWSFLERGAEVAIMLPNYMQAWGVAKTLQTKVLPVWLKEKQGRWVFEVDKLRKSVSKRTKLIAVCNPNNPTGSVLDESEIEQICDIAKKVGAWVLSDEVYRGAELAGSETATFWGRYEKSIVTSGLSKAYGLPGLRLGWMAAKGKASKLWSYRDYTTIAPGAISDYLARRVLQPETRNRILARTRKILQSNLPILTRWVERHRNYLSFIPPKAGAIAYLKYSLNINSTELAKRLLREKSTLIVPGDQFRMGRYLRVGFGGTQDRLEAGLARVGEFLVSLQATGNSH
jgi:aspartate/methionine/tyrosine aminotransferase